MTLQITNKQDYILVQPSAGVNFWEIIEALGKLFAMDEFPPKSDIWVFREGPVRILYDDFYKIKNLLAEHFPERIKGHKTAMVVETGFLSGIAESYADIAKELDVQVRVFSDLKSAKDWLKVG
jgi:hypothetical protein